MMKDRVVKQKHRCIDRRRVQHAIENRPDQQRDHAMRRADAGHKKDRKQQICPVFPRESEQVQQVSHAWTRMRSNASITCWVVAFRITADCVLHGPQMAGSDVPKITTTGRPTAAAMCAGPESLPRNNDAPRMSALISLRDAPTTVRKSRKADRFSPGPAMKTGLRS